MSNAISTLGIRQRTPIQIGSIQVQQNTIRLSYRSRGRVARIHTKININTRALIPRIRLCTLIKLLLLKISVIL